MATQFPDDFFCPISLEIMSDPVILPSGHTFDRPSIQRWLDAGHRTCPLTKLPLPEHPPLIPNHALRSLISNYTLPSPLPQPDRKQSHHNHSQPQTLISTLTSPASSLDSKLDLLDRLNKMAKDDAAFRAKLTEFGAVAAGLKCLDSGEPCLQVKALTLLLNVSLDDDGNKVGMVAEGVLDRVVAVLQGGSPKSRAVAATVLTSLALVEVNKGTIGADQYVIPALVSLLRDGKWPEKKEAATALHTLCSFSDNRRRAVECGAVAILLRIADSGLDRAVEVLGQLARSKDGREEMQRFSGCVRILVRVLENGTSRGVQHALLTLSSVCRFSEKMHVEARNQGVLAICMCLVEVDNEKIRENACYLIQVLDGNHSMI
ncbi:hypothetical protein ACLB2K_033152 [Fragaria x ananassa]